MVYLIHKYYHNRINNQKDFYWIADAILLPANSDEPTHNIDIITQWSIALLKKANLFIIDNASVRPYSFRVHAVGEGPLGPHIHHKVQQRRVVLHDRI